MKKARIWFADGLWRLDIPGYGYSKNQYSEIIFDIWRGFLVWAK